MEEQIQEFFPIKIHEEKKYVPTWLLKKKGLGAQNLHGIQENLQAKKIKETEKAILLEVISKDAIDNGIASNLSIEEISEMMAIQEWFPKSQVLSREEAWEKGSHCNNWLYVRQEMKDGRKIGDIINEKEMKSKIEIWGQDFLIQQAKKELVEKEGK